MSSRSLEENRNEVSRYFMMQFMITGKCNLRCKHCYEDDVTQHDASAEEQISIVEQYFKTMEAWGRVPYLAISGGEPFLGNSFWKIMDYAQDYYERKGRGAFEVLTNGTLINPSMAKKLTNYTAMGFVQVSLDGASAEIHDRIRGKGTFSKAVEALINLKNVNIRTAIHYVVHKNNYADAFKITDLAVKLRVNQLLVTRLIPFGRGKEIQHLMLSPEETRKLYLKLSDDADRLFNKYKTGKTQTLILRNRCDWPLIYPEPENYESGSIFTKNGGRCQAGLIHIAVMQDGTVYPCRRMPVSLGNLLEQGFSTIWNHEFLWKIRLKHSFMKGKCAKCPFNNDPSLNYSCSGGASCVSYGFYGDPFMPDPQCWYDPTKSGN